MDISTLQRLHRMGILSTDQAKHFALGGEYTNETDPLKSYPVYGQPIDPFNLDLAQLASAKRSYPGLTGNEPNFSDILENNDYPRPIPFKPITEFSMAPQTIQGAGVPVTTTPTSSNGNPQSFGADYEAYMADEAKYKGIYRDAQAVDNAFTSGLITQQERDRLQLLSPEQLKAEKKPLTGDQNVDMNAVNSMSPFPFMSPIGGDFTSNMFQAGRAIAAPAGTAGRGLGIGLNVGAGLLEAARGIGSGMAYQNMNSQTQNYYNDLMKRRQYTNASQTQNANITGGVATAREGGLFHEQHFILGGEQQPPTEEQQAPQEGQQDPQEQMVQIAQQLVAGLQSLEAIDAYLKEQKVDEQTYNAVMQIAQQLIEEQSQGEQSETTEETPSMKNGGKFKHKVGDKIEFTHKGKKHRGVIKKIENGQIYL